jgi:hypothetical protein
MITKVSEITTADIADFIRLGEVSDAEEKQLQTFLNVAKDYIANYTALTDLDEYADLVIAVYVLCQDMYDNRSLYIDKNNPNKVVQTILDMHTRCNL